MSPLSRTLAWAKAQGWKTWIAERYIAAIRLKQDLYGLFDATALRPGTPGITGLQATTSSNVAAHLDKMLANDILPLWLECGNGAILIGWSKRGARGKRKLWTSRIIDFHLSAGGVVHAERGDGDQADPGGVAAVCGSGDGRLDEEF